MNKYVVKYCNDDDMECRWHCTASSSQHAVDMLREMFDGDIDVRMVELLIDMKGEWE